MSKFFIIFQISIVLLVWIYIKMNYRLVELDMTQVAELNAQSFINSSALMPDESGNMRESVVLVHVGKWALVKE